MTYNEVKRQSGLWDQAVSVSCVIKDISGSVFLMFKIGIQILTMILLE
jgi:hypothetical protein